MMYGQMTAGSWIYIGSQGIVQGTYETFVEAGRQHYGGDLAGPLDPDRRPRRHGRRAAARRQLRRRLLPEHRVPADPHRLPPALALSRRAGQRPRRRAGAHRSATPRERKAVSIGLLGNAAEILPELVNARGRRPEPDLVTDQTSAHDLVNGYLPIGWSVEGWRAAQADAGQHAALRDAAAASCAVHVQAMLDFQAMGIPTVDYGNNIRQVAFDRRREERLRLPRLRARLHPAAVLPRQGAVPLGGALGRPGRHPQDRCQDEGAVPRGRAPASLARHGRRAHRLPGPAGAHLLARPGRAPSCRPGLQRDGEERAN